MSNEALKLEIIEWLTSLSDKAILEYLKIVKDSTSQTNEWWNDLTHEQKKRIKAGLSQISSAETLSHEDVKSKYGL